MRWGWARCTAWTAGCGIWASWRPGWTPCSGSWAGGCPRCPRAARAVHGPAAEFFAQCAQKIRGPGEQTFQEIWREGLSGGRLRLAKEDRALLERLGPVLGRYDGDSQRGALEETAAGLRSLQGTAADDRRRLGRVYGVLGTTVGLLLAILLI